MCNPKEAISVAFFGTLVVWASADTAENWIRDEIEGGLKTLGTMR